MEDVNEALVFYRDVLGFTVEKQECDDYAMLWVPGGASPIFATGAHPAGVWMRAVVRKSMKSPSQSVPESQLIWRTPLPFSGTLIQPASS